MNRTPTDILTLYHYWRSSCSWRVRWAFQHKGVSYQSEPINLLNSEQTSVQFLAKNPAGYVPALELAEGVFGESLAIMEWIEETWPHSPLLPSAPTDRMRVRQICQLVVSGTQPIQNLSVLKKHSSDPGEQAIWARYWIEQGLTKLEALVSTTAGTYCFGGSLTMADLCLVPQIFNALRFQVDMTQFPTLWAINTKCLMLPTCQAAAPANQPGAV